MHPNGKMITRILNEAHEQFGNGLYRIVQNLCPNLTCCFDCRIDDFCHVEGCEIVKGVADKPVMNEMFRRKYGRPPRRGDVYKGDICGPYSYDGIVWKEVEERSDPESSAGKIH
jgi:hypothetical protein